MINLEETRRLFDILKQVENGQAEFFERCAEKWEEKEPPFWSRLAEQERVHARMVEEMASMVASAPEDFRPGRLIVSRAPADTLDLVRKNLQRLQSGEFTETDALRAALMLERSGLESMYHEFLSSDTATFQTIVHRISGHTREHQILISRRLALLMSAPALPVKADDFIAREADLT